MNENWVGIEIKLLGGFGPNDSYKFVGTTEMNNEKRLVVTQTVHYA